MLVSPPARRRPDDEGAVLVAVVVVMFVGFIIVSVVMAAALSALRSNDSSLDELEALVAAESGRDAAVAALTAGCSIDAPIVGAAPEFTATIYTTRSDTAPGSHSASGLTADSCPDADTTFVVIHAVGTGPDGATAEVDAVYPWVVAHETSLGGIADWDEGTFSTVPETGLGDLVVREGDYLCEAGADVDGDLWVLGGASGTDGGSVSLAAGCTIAGTVRARGTVTTESGAPTGISIGGDIVATGGVLLDADGLGFDGTIRSGADIVLAGAGTALDVIAAGTIELGEWEPTGVVEEEAPSPEFTPTFAELHALTGWIDLGSGGWETGSETVDACLLSPSTRRDPVRLFDDRSSRLVVDYTSCPADIFLGSGDLTRDVALVIGPWARLDVRLDGSLSSPGGHQLLVVHADAAPSDGVPTCAGAGSGFGLSDDFDVSPGVSIDVPVLVYTPCRLGGDIDSDFAGQIYADGDDTHAPGAPFTCTPMTWEPTLGTLACTIGGEETAEGVGTVVQRLDALLRQTEH